MKKFDYRFYTLSEPEIHDGLEKMGDAGWEIKYVGFDSEKKEYKILFVREYEGFI